MRYLRFEISNYRAISGPLTVDLSKRHLVPVIGINESGKTTILHAIYAFDPHNDGFDKAVRHLKDTNNLLDPGSESAVVIAEIECSKGEVNDVINDILHEVKGEDEKAQEKRSQLRKIKKAFKDYCASNGDRELLALRIGRDLKSKRLFVDVSFPSDRTE